MKTKIITLALVLSAFMSQNIFAQNNTEQTIEKGINLASEKISKVMADAENAVGNRTKREIKELKDSVKAATKEATEAAKNAAKEATKEAAKNVVKEAAKEVTEELTGEGVTLYSDTTDQELAEDTTAYKNSNNGSGWVVGIENLGFDKDNPAEILFACAIVICVIVIPTLCLFGLPLLIIWIVARNRRKRERERNELIKSLAESGKDVSVLLNEQIKENKIVAHRNETTYNKGIKNICLGVGLGLMLYLITHSTEVASVGVLIACIGVGQILSSKHSATDTNHNAESKQNDESAEEI